MKFKCFSCFLCDKEQSEMQ